MNKYKTLLLTER